MEVLPSYMDKSYFDAIHTISDDEAFRRVKELAVKEGLLVGSSSGSAFCASLRKIEHAQPDTNITIFPDSRKIFKSKYIQS